jgi:NADP-dependent 3-hydroxy acid dehydrogenase YdfG
MTQGTWFIAGISSSFGRKIAEQLLARGDQVIGTLRRTDSVKDLKARYGDQLRLAYLDLSNRAEIRDMVVRLPAWSDNAIPV